jgi:2-amino-4-hydroxy-6-hydroxymethyldihydropteridine diphosphokinase
MVCALIDSMLTDAFIALGSNLGDRERNLLQAASEIGRLPSSKITALSPFYETTPVGFTEQPLFYNAVLQLHTGLSPLDLHKCLQKIEDSVFSRKRLLQWGPRIMDIDMLLYGDEVIGCAALTIPHPRLAERRFVLQPLCDIAPCLMHPVLKRQMAEILAGLHTDEILKKI